MAQGGAQQNDKKKSFGAVIKRDWKNNKEQMILPVILFAVLSYPDVARMMGRAGQFPMNIGVYAIAYMGIRNIMRLRK
jgi:hypothetical protein